MSFARELRIVVALPSSHLTISASLSVPTSRNGWIPRFGISRGARSRGTTGTKVGHLALASVQGQDPGHTGPRLVTSFWPLPRGQIQGTRGQGWLLRFGLWPAARSIGAQPNTVSYFVLASAQRPDPGAQRNLSSNIPFHIWPYPICVLKGQTERQTDKGSNQM